MDKKEGKRGHVKNTAFDAELQSSGLTRCLYTSEKSKETKNKDNRL